MGVDLIIIGGGINGVAIAREAALRGLSVTLFEKGRLGDGASSNTSKLAHGGLRYLEQFKFGLVRESLRERDLLLKNCPDLVKPMPFIFPVYKGGKRPMWQIAIGLFVYDFFSRKGSLPRHKHLTVSQVQSAVPGINSDLLLGGFCYYDAQMDDAEIVRRNAAHAKDSGAKIIERARVVGVNSNEGKAVGVLFESEGKVSELKSSCILNCSGAWSNGVMAWGNGRQKVSVYPTKGVHLICPSQGLETAMILSAPQDNRIFFVMPWKGKTLIGTTDTDFSGDPDSVKCTDDDQRYLLMAVSHYFPDWKLRDEDVLETFVGLRPLVKEAAKSASDISRDFHLSRSETGVVTLLGGKFTTHRYMAEQTVDYLLDNVSELPRSKAAQTAFIPLTKEII
ncbi:glycerol-3-phosphate dehydrogenase/oxidase [bacterium]|jgi:glycerol-3-phosphate dehydrogenase|nr:glycerol-3-phosphate dehydrogenase/oxidase [bacterium]